MTVQALIQPAFAVFAVAVKDDENVARKKLTWSCAREASRQNHRMSAFQRGGEGLREKVHLSPQTMKSRAKTSRFSRAVLWWGPLGDLQLCIQEHRAVEIVLGLVAEIGEVLGQSWREINCVGEDAVAARGSRPVSRANAYSVDAGVAVAVGRGGALRLRGGRAAVQRRRGSRFCDFK
jgi:hypothetical protein